MWLYISLRGGTDFFSAWRNSDWWYSETAALHLKPLHFGRSPIAIATKPQLTRRPAGVRKHHGQPRWRWRVQKASRHLTISLWTLGVGTVQRCWRAQNTAAVATLVAAKWPTDYLRGASTRRQRDESVKVEVTSTCFHFCVANSCMVKFAMTLYSSRPWTTCPLSCHNPTWNALGQRTVPCTFFSSKSRLQWEQIVIAQDSAPIVGTTSSSRLLILNGSNCEIAWESLMVWKLETCLTLQKIGKHRRQSAGAWQTADPVPDPSTVQSTRPQRHQKMSTRFIKARTFQHTKHPNPSKPFVFVEAANEMLALNLVSESDLLNTLM